MPEATDGSRPQSPIVEAVIGDLRERTRKGTAAYGRPLTAFNGRDSVWDAYEEVLDLSKYLRQHRRELAALGADLRDLASRCHWSQPLPTDVQAAVNAILDKYPFLQPEPQQ